MGSDRAGGPRNEPVIWMAHRVRPAASAAFGTPDCYRLRGTSVTLDELLDALDRPLVDLLELGAALAAGGPLPTGDVLTFDDGYAEWPEVARALGDRPAAWFLCDAFRAEAPRPHPVDALYWLLDHAEVPTLDWEGAWRLDDVVSKGQLVCDSPLKRAVARGPAPWAVLARLQEALQVCLPADLPERLYPSAADRAVLGELGTVGAHGASHRWLTDLDDEALAGELGRTPASRAVAWPDGAFDARVVRIARGAGYTLALTCEPGAVRIGSDPMRLPRRLLRAREAA